MKNRSRREQIVAQAFRAGAVVALIAAAGLGAPVIRDEWISSQLEAIATQDLAAGPPRLGERGDASPSCAVDCPPRADAALGAHLALQASRTSAPRERHALLVQARQWLQTALRARPADAGWWTWMAYVRSLDDDGEAQVLDAIARSYAFGPFLADEGPWRAMTCAANWPQLSPQIRRNVVDEVVWLRDIDPRRESLVAAAFQDPDAASALRVALARPRALLVPHRRSRSPDGVGPAG